MVKILYAVTAIAMFITGIMSAIEGDFEMSSLKFGVAALFWDKLA